MVFFVAEEFVPVTAEFPATRRPIRVLIVDDTRTIRNLIRALLARDPRVEVVGEAGDPYEARELIKVLEPDVLTLDVEMPRMNGLVFLEKIMRLRPMPVVMVSTRTAEQSDAAVRALSLGALDCIDLKLLQRRDPRVAKLSDVLVMAGNANVRTSRARAATVGMSKSGATYDWNGRSVFIGSSTGGVDALMQVLSDFPENCPPTVVVQHMPAPFLESFARRLDSHCAADVRLAVGGEALKPGQVLLAAGGDHHVRITEVEAKSVAVVPDDGTALYVPSVAVLFRSAVALGEKAVGVMLTGMGCDGAAEMLEMRKNGAHTIAQSPETVVVDGMPRAARECGAVVDVCDIGEIGRRILSVTSRAMSR